MRMCTWPVVRVFGVLVACGAILTGCNRGDSESDAPEVRPVRSVTIAKSEGGSSITLSGRAKYTNSKIHGLA